MRGLTAPIVDADVDDVTDAVEIADGVEFVEADADGVLQARTSFLEASRRYLFDTDLPAARETQWQVVQPQRPWISSRAARRSRAWPAASEPWGRR